MIPLCHNGYMIYDELLAKIDIWKFQTKGYDDTYEVHGILNALRAVVELHKPFDFFWGEPFTSCECGEEYPCKTIQIIEKELS